MSGISSRSIFISTFGCWSFVSACVCMPQLEEHDQQNSASRQVPLAACLVGHLLVTWMLAPKPAAIYNYSSVCALDATDVVWPKALSGTCIMPDGIVHLDG